MGSLWGRVPIYGKKTLEGQLGFVAGVLGVVAVLMRGSLSWKVLVVILLSSIEELVCEEIDNYILPLFFMSLLLGINCRCLLFPCSPS